MVGALNEKYKIVDVNKKKSKRALIDLTLLSKKSLLVSL